MIIFIYLIAFLPVNCECFLSGTSFGKFANLGSWYASLQFTNCWFGSCCKKTWNEGNFIELKKDLKKKIYGQHIAVDIVTNHLKSHFLNPHQKKALALSLHGTTGSGKNYLTSIAVSHLLKNGMKDSNLKLWNAKHHFSNIDKLSQYQEDLRREIGEQVSRCPRSIFIFDEANELPPGLLNVLKPMMDEYEQLDGIDFRQATFFFLSNTGAEKINKVVMEFRNKQRDRSELKLSDFQPLIQDGSFNEKGGFLKSKLIEKNLIDSYVPFLPLEEEHVKLCVKYYLRVRHCSESDDLVQKVSNLVNYEPPGKRYFSPYGCRGVDNFIKQEIDDDCIFNIPRDEL